MAHVDPALQFGDLFTALPWQIIANVCQFLPMKMISGVLLKVPSLRSFIIEQYYREEICLYLVDPDGTGAFYNSYEPAVAHVIGSENIKAFLSTNPDIVPDQYTIYPDLKYIGLEDVLRTYQEVLARAEGLEIRFKLAYLWSWPERIEPSKELMDLIFSFENLYSLETWCSKGSFELLPKHEGLEEFVLNAWPEIEYSSISLPPNLEKFDLNICTNSDSEDETDSDDEIFVPDGMFSGSERYAARHSKELISYGELYKLLWKVSPRKSPAIGVARCPSLAELSLNNCRIHTLESSLFPSTLKSLKIDCCTITSVVHKRKRRPFWPENLEDLTLSDNNMRDRVVHELSQLGWPRRLEALFLCNNWITSLKHLFNLPETLQVLYLNDSHRLTDLNLVNDGTGYRMASLPDSLKTLTLYWCENIDWGHFNEEEPTQISERLHFPPNLTELDLSDCDLQTTEHFVFPPTLQKLEMPTRDPED